MKMAVCSAGNTVDSAVDPRFGRCQWFVIVDTETMDMTAKPNPGAVMAQGAGVEAARVVLTENVGAVVAARFGPHAVQALSAAGVKMYQGVAGTVRQIVDRYKAGQLEIAADLAPTPSRGQTASAAGTGAPRGRRRLGAGGAGRGCQARGFGGGRR
jgi:predicted Fe-Mo cluster-binding NifX family protein